MNVEQVLAALREEFQKEIRDLWSSVPDLAGSGDGRLQAMAAHHKDYTDQHLSMFLNEIQSLSVLFRHLMDEEIGHAQKATETFQQLGNAAPAAAEQPPCDVHSGATAVVAMPVPATAAVPPAPIIGFTVGSLKGKPERSEGSRTGVSPVLAREAGKLQPKGDA